VKFFIRLKNSVIKFEEYQNFSTEKITNGIKYFITLLLIFALISTIVFTYITYITINDAISLFEESFPEFRALDNELIIETEEEIFVLGDETQNFAVVAVSGYAYARVRF